MYERSYGYKYDEVEKYAGATEIAKKIRADIKVAVGEGLLPAHWKYGVRSDGNSIHVNVRDCADAWKACDGNCTSPWCAKRNVPGYEHGATDHDVLTADGEVAKMTLQRIHCAYNHDGSEIQVDYFDVRYYGGVSFEDASSAAFRAKEAARLAERKANRESGTVVGKVANFSGRGRPVVHVLVEAADGKKVLGCGARISRRSLVSKVNDDAAVTCTRCARREV